MMHLQKIHQTSEFRPNLPAIDSCFFCSLYPHSGNFTAMRFIRVFVLKCS